MTLKTIKSTLTIVIPVYNEERYIGACLDSIAAQTIMPLEVIVVDNNCSDNSMTIAKKYSFVRIVKEEQQGRSQARSAGFNAARADIIGRIDADVELPTDWVEHIQTFYGDPDNLAVAWSGGPRFYNVRLPRLVNWAYSFMIFRFNYLLTGITSLWGSNMAIRREHWERVKNGLHDQIGTHEDLDLTIHLHRAGIRSHYDSAVKVRAEMRRVHTNHHEMWDYLQWWPRTLRTHGYKTWIICWFFGAFVIYYATKVLIFVDLIARHIGKKTPVN